MIGFLREIFHINVKDFRVMHIQSARCTYLHVLLSRFNGETFVSSLRQQCVSSYEISSRDLEREALELLQIERKKLLGLLRVLDLAQISGHQRQREQQGELLQEK